MKQIILVVEDESSIADTIVYALETEGFDVKHCLTGQSAINTLKSHKISCIVLDVGLPDINGFDLFREIRKAHQTPVIFLTARDDVIDRVAGLEMGADDYLTKPFSPRELTARVRAIIRRCANAETSDKDIKAVQNFTVDKERCKISYHGEPLELSRYEYQLLCILLDNPGRVYSRDRLMELVWDDPGSSLDRTVDAHIKSIRNKLRSINQEEDPIQTHRGMGYSLREKSDY